MAKRPYTSWKTKARLVQDYCDLARELERAWSMLQTEKLARMRAEERLAQIGAERDAASPSG